MLQGRTMSEHNWEGVAAVGVVMVGLVILVGMMIVHDGTLKAIEKGYRPTERMGTIVWEPNDCK